MTRRAEVLAEIGALLGSSLDSERMLLFRLPPRLRCLNARTSARPSATVPQAAFRTIDQGSG